MARKIAFGNSAIYVYELPFGRHPVTSKLTGLACSGHVDILALTICHTVAEISLVHLAGERLDAALHQIDAESVAITLTKN